MGGNRGENINEMDGISRLSVKCVREGILRG